VTEININVHQVTRVEGHGNIVLNAKDGKIEELRWEIPESPRFFEVMFRGRSYEDVPLIASRICGICSAASALFPIPPVRYKPPKLPSVSNHQSRHCCYVNCCTMPRCWRAIYCTSFSLLLLTFWE